MIKAEITTNRVNNLLSPETMASLVLNGDVGKLNATQKVEYYNALCERIGLDPATQPFKLLTLNGKQILYADKGATQQLCKIYNVSTEVIKKEKFEDIYVVTVRAKMPTPEGERFTDEDGAVNIKGFGGDPLANALMKTVTKAKRRAVLALCGLGMLDETEIETIKGAVPVDLNAPTDDGLEQSSAHLGLESKITEDQMSTIYDLINADELDTKKFLEFMKVEKVADILASDYNKAVNAIKATAAKKKAGRL